MHYFCNMITSVTGTVMDFRDGRYLGTDIEASTLQTARGYDHNWVIGTGYYQKYLPH